MKFKNLNNQEIRIDIHPSKYPRLSEGERLTSSGQASTGTLLRDLYGKNAIILENFLIPDTKLSLDFYLPHYKLAFEYQGKQHDSFNKFFHVDKSGFDKQVVRDGKKRDWCSINNICLIEVRDTPTIEKIKELIEEMRTNGKSSI